MRCKWLRQDNHVQEAKRFCSHVQGEKRERDFTSHCIFTELIYFSRLRQDRWYGIAPICKVRSVCEYVLIFAYFSSLEWGGEMGDNQKVGMICRHFHFVICLHSGWRELWCWCIVIAFHTFCKHMSRKAEATKKIGSINKKKQLAQDMTLNFQDVKMHRSQ